MSVYDAKAQMYSCMHAFLKNTVCDSRGQEVPEYARGGKAWVAAYVSRRLFSMASRSEPDFFAYGRLPPVQ